MTRANSNIGNRFPTAWRRWLPIVVLASLTAACGLLPEADSGTSPDGDGSETPTPAGPTRGEAMQVLAYALDDALTIFYNENMVGRGAGFYTLTPNCPLQGVGEIRGNLALSPVPGGTSISPDLYFYFDRCGFTTRYGELVLTTPATAYEGSSGQTLDGNVDRAVHFRGSWINDGVGNQTAATVSKSGTVDVRGTIDVDGAPYEVTQESECAFSLTFEQDSADAAFTGVVCGISLVTNR